MFSTIVYKFSVCYNNLFPPGGTIGAGLAGGYSPVKVASTFTV